MDGFRREVETHGLCNVVFQPYQPLERLGASFDRSGCASGGVKARVGGVDRAEQVLWGHRGRMSHDFSR